MTDISNDPTHTVITIEDDSDANTIIIDEEENEIIDILSEAGNISQKFTAIDDGIIFGPKSTAQPPKSHASEASNLHTFKSIIFND